MRSLRPGRARQDLRESEIAAHRRAYNSGRGKRKRRRRAEKGDRGGRRSRTAAPDPPFFGRERTLTPFVIVVRVSTKARKFIFLAAESPEHTPDRRGGRASNQSNALSSRRLSGARRSH